MTIKAHKWWWEGYAVLFWSGILAIPAFHWSDQARYIFFPTLFIFPLALLFLFSAIRRGSVLAKLAVIAAALIATLAIYHVFFYVGDGDIFNTRIESYPGKLPPSATNRILTP